MRRGEMLKPLNVAKHGFMLHPENQIPSLHGTSGSSLLGISIVVKNFGSFQSLEYSMFWKTMNIDNWQQFVQFDLRAWVWKVRIVMQAIDIIRVQAECCLCVVRKNDKEETKLMSMIVSLYFSWALVSYSSGNWTRKQQWVFVSNQDNSNACSHVSFSLL